MPYNQITTGGTIAPGPDPTGPNKATIHKIIYDTLNSGGFSFTWNCAHQPYHGTLDTGGTSTIDLYIYAWRIISGSRVSRPSEKRIEIRNAVDRVGFVRPITSTQKTLLLGIYDSPHGSPIFAAWPADDPLNVNPRQRSVYVDVEDLQAAITEGIHHCTNSKGDEIFTFLPEFLGDYIDLVEAGNTFAPAVGITPTTPRTGTASPTTLSSKVKRATKPHKKSRTIRSVNDVLASISRVTETEREAVTKQRVGQGYFKELLLDKYACKCALCNVTTKSMLVASHIKNWSESTDAEKLDENNGLLLCAHHDALFDKHLITFDNTGTLLVSPTLSPAEQRELQISAIPSLTISPGMLPYLAVHRSKLKR